MKLLYSVLLILIAITAFPNPIIRAKANGRWAQSTTWDLNRLPQTGDTVLVPANIDVTLDFNESLNNIFLKITGVLKLNNGKLNLNASSRIIIGQEGRLSGNGNNDQVKIGGDFKFRGGVDISILGPAFADTSTGISPNGFEGGFSLLKATLTNFAVNRVNDKVYIEWEIAPANTIRFEIERSFNGNNWSTIKSIPVAGNTKYLFTDRIHGTTYYRIKQVFATTVSYTAVKVVNDKGGINISSTPAQKLRVSADNFPLKITVMDMSGKVLQRLNYERPADVSLNNGRFIVHVADAAGNEKSGIVIL